MIQVFYDKQCGTCNRLATYFRQVTQHRSIVWHDATESRTLLESSGISLHDALTALHAYDESNHWHKGIDAIILILNELARWRWLARLLSAPGIYSVSGYIYRIIANNRHLLE